MDEYFKKYLNAKYCLYKMVTQFLNTYISTNDAINLGLPYIESDTSMVEVCFHDYQSDGILAWEYLQLPRDFMTHREIWELQDEIRDEEFDSSRDYKEEYLRIAVLLIDMTKNYYPYKISEEEAIKHNIPYDDTDEYLGEVDCCDHLCEGAGESVWNLFDIDGSVVGQSVFDKKRDEIIKELMNKNEDIKRRILNK